MCKFFTLQELYEILKITYGDDVTIRSRTWGLFGDGEHELWKDGVKRATWKSRLINIPSLDGVTPRGPSEYYDLVHLSN